MERVEYLRGQLHSISKKEDFGEAIIEVFHESDHARAVVHLLTDTLRIRSGASNLVLTTDDMEIRLCFRRLSKKSKNLRHIVMVEGDLSSYAIQQYNIDIEKAETAGAEIATHVSFSYPNLNIFSRFRSEAENAFKQHESNPNKDFIESNSLRLYEDGRTSIMLCPTIRGGYTEERSYLSAGNEIRIILNGYLPEHDAVANSTDWSEALRHILSFLEGTPIEFSHRQVTYYTNDETVPHSSEHIFSENKYHGNQHVPYDTNICIRIIVKYFTLLHSLNQERIKALHVFMHRFLTAKAAPDISITVAMIHSTLQYLISFTDPKMVAMRTKDHAMRVLRMYGIDGSEEDATAITDFNNIRNKLFKSTCHTDDTYDISHICDRVSKMRQFITQGFAKLMKLDAEETDHLGRIVRVLYR